MDKIQFAFKCFMIALRGYDDGNVITDLAIASRRIDPNAMEMLWTLRMNKRSWKTETHYNAKDKTVTIVWHET